MNLSDLMRKIYFLKELLGCTEKKLKLFLISTFPLMNRANELALKCAFINRFLQTCDITHLPDSFKLQMQPFLFFFILHIFVVIDQIDFNT